MRIFVQVTPNAKVEKVEEIAPNRYKIKVRAKPLDGEANDRMIELLSIYLGISKKSIHLLKGKTARQKVLEISV